jgi:hypothetical protein
MPAEYGFVQFVSDDDGFLRWLREDPHGLVVNSHRVPVSTYLKLHRASCPSINTPHRTNWTTTGYIKTCSTDLTALVEWARREVDGTLTPCGMCKPVLRTRPDSSPARPEPVSPGPTIVTVPEDQPPITPTSPAGERTLPSEISTGCPELDLAWKTFASMILHRSQILIPDTEDDLNWHAFLGHSIDMQGFRAAEFVGVDPLTKKAPEFVPLKTRGIGILELAKLWEIDVIREHLLRHAKGTPLSSTLLILRKWGGQIGGSLAEAFESFPYRRGHWTVRAYLNNSEVLRASGYSFRAWLQRECERLGAREFPPPDFRVIVRRGETLEMALRKRLMASFIWVKDAMSPYMICDWQLWLWRQGRTAIFASFKLDKFHEMFVRKFGRGVIPSDEAGFAQWWLGLFPEIPPRLANECIWLAVEKKLVNVR